MIPCTIILSCVTVANFPWFQNFITHGIRIYKIKYIYLYIRDIRAMFVCRDFFWGAANFVMLCFLCYEYRCEPSPPTLQETSFCREKYKKRISHVYFCMFKHVNSTYDYDISYLQLQVKINEPKAILQNSSCIVSR